MNISNYNEIINEIKTGAIILIVIILYVRSFLKNKKLKYEDLYQNDFYQTEYKFKKNEHGLKEQTESKNIVVELNDKELVFRKYNRQFTIEVFTEKKQVLEFLYNSQFIDPIKQKVMFQDQPSIIFRKEEFKTLENYELKDDSPNQMFTGISPLGLEGYEKVNDNNVYILAGGQGSGKTQTALRMLETYTTNNPNIKEWIIVDTKSNHFNRYGKVYRLETIEEYEELNEKIENLIIENQEYSYKNMPNLTPTGFLFEECLDYLKADKIGYSKPMIEQRERLQKNVQTCIRKFREFGMSPFILLMQEVSTQAINIPTSLLNVKLYAKIPTQNMCTVLGVSKDGMDSDLRHGRWIRIETSKKSQFPLSMHEKYRNYKKKEEPKLIEEDETNDT
jgi:hypothetical protein